MVFPTQAENCGYKGQQISPKVLLNKEIFRLQKYLPAGQGVTARGDLLKLYTLEKKNIKNLTGPSEG